MAFADHQGGRFFVQRLDDVLGSVRWAKGWHGWSGGEFREILIVGLSVSIQGFSQGLELHQSAVGIENVVVSVTELFVGASFGDVRLQLGP
ncbi:hypothetical protein D3C75_1246180 [compost metagenome]